MEEFTRRKKTFEKDLKGESKILMETTLRRLADGEEGDIEATRSLQQSNITDHEENSKNEFMLLKDDQLGSVKAEMCKVRQENESLKACLDKVTVDYQTLKNKFQNIAHEQVDQAPTKSMDQEKEPEFVCLSLGRSSPGQGNGDDSYKEKNGSPKKIGAASPEISLKDKEEGLVKLGLNCKFDEGPFSKPNQSMEYNSPKEVVVQDTWSPKTSLKTVRSTGEDDEVSVQQNPAKKARVSVRVRCEAPTMNDGCQWRKYGQKIAKGNPCPRAYYRCTVAPSCPVRKQVQRCSQDRSILISTYEGTHSHPLPTSATAMASTTSAAAVMLLSGSSSSTSSGPGPSPSATAIAAQQLHGLNYYLSKSNPSSFNYLLNSSNLSSPSCPSITLDLANNPSSSSLFNRLFTTNYPQKYHNSSTSNLNFSSTTFESNTAPVSWSYGNSSHQSPYNQTMSSFNFGSRQPQENMYHSSMQKENGTNVASTQQNFQPHSIEAATKAITSDPSFQSALAVAITSIMNTNGTASQRVKLEQPSPLDNKSGFGLQYMNSQQSNLMLSSTPLPMSSSRSNSPTSPGDSK